jgi:hypothetical protein
MKTEIDRMFFFFVKLPSVNHIWLQLGYRFSSWFMGTGEDDRAYVTSGSHELTTCFAAMCKACSRPWTNECFVS